jgi:hypothetical protein
MFLTETDDSVHHLLLERYYFTYLQRSESTETILDKFNWMTPILGRNPLDSHLCWRHGEQMEFVSWCGIVEQKATIHVLVNSVPHKRVCLLMTLI